MAKDQSRPNIALLPSQNSQNWYGFSSQKRFKGVCIKSLNNVPTNKPVDHCEQGGKFECSTNADCINNDTSFTCQCKKGYQDVSIYPDVGLSCVDVDECKYTGGKASIKV